MILRPAAAFLISIAAWSPAAEPLSARAEVIDRVVAVVGVRAITASELERQLRLAALLDDRPFDGSAEARQQALKRLIERRLIQQEIALAKFLEANRKDVNKVLDELRRSRFEGNLDFAAALARYKLNEADVRAFMAEIISYQRYYAFRFKTGLDVPEEDVEELYRERYGAADSSEPAQPTLDEVRERLESELRDRIAEPMLIEHVRELRAETRVVILPGAADVPAASEGAP